MWIPRHRGIPTKHEEWMALFIDNDHDDDPVMAQARPSPSKPGPVPPVLLPALLPTPAKIGQQFSLLVPFRCTFTLPLCLYPKFQSWDENFEIVSYCKNFHTRMYEIPFYMHCCNFITSKSGGKHFVIFEYGFCFLKIKYMQLVSLLYTRLKHFSPIVLEVILTIWVSLKSSWSFGA